MNDGSKDSTQECLEEIYSRHDANVVVINFSRNFGKEAAMYAGLQRSVGEMTCIIDAELQQRPEVVVQMVHILDENPRVDSVAAYQKKKGKAYFRAEKGVLSPDQ